MYIPKHFEIEKENIMYDIIKNNSFATLFSQHNGNPYATHLPLVLDRDRGLLVGHFARSNPHWKSIGTQNVLAVFHGPHCYISPSWYETNNAVPTWNYVTVHVYGKVEILENKLELKDSLFDMVRKYEKQDSSYNLDKTDSDYLNSMTKGIVGFKIKINKIEGKKKLSQNHSVDRQKRIIKQLEEINNNNTRQIAVLMKENL